MHKNKIVAVLVAIIYSKEKNIVPHCIHLTLVEFAHVPFFAHLQEEWLSCKIFQIFARVLARRYITLQDTARVLQDLPRKTIKV